MKACRPVLLAIGVMALAACARDVATASRQTTPPRTVEVASAKSTNDWRPRTFPDSSARIAILADQLPGGLTAAQQRFVAHRFVGTQKLTLDLSRPLRALNPGFIVLHYHLAMWQSAPNVSFIVDGRTWGNDFPEVNKHDAWFWHTPSGQRVASSIDGKLLMNIGDAGFVRYWTDSVIEQSRAGDYDAVFFDSASPALLAWEANAPPEPRLAGTGARDTRIRELGDRTFIEAWQPFMTSLNAATAAAGLPLIPNTGSFVTSWDPTRYDLTAGVFVEGFADPGFSETDWNLMKQAPHRTTALGILGGVRGRRVLRPRPRPGLLGQRRGSGRTLPRAGQVRPVRREPRRLRGLRPGVHGRSKRARPDRRAVHPDLRQQGPRPPRSRADKSDQRGDQRHRHHAVPDGARPVHEAAGQGLRQRRHLPDGARAR